MGISWITPLYLLAIYGMIRYVSKQEKTDKINWSPLDSVAITVFIYFIGQIAGQLLIAVITGLIGWNQDQMSIWLEKHAIGQFFTVLVVYGTWVLLLKQFLKRRGNNWRDIGLFGRPKFTDAGWAVAGYLIYLAIYVLAITLIKKLIPSIDLNQEQDVGFNQVSSSGLPFVFMSLVILPPIVEELIMRGFLYTGLQQKLPKIAAVVITSVMFAIAHLQYGGSAPLLWVAAIDTFVLSVVLIQLKDKTGKLWSPIFLHGIKNLIAFMALFVFR